MSIQAIKTEMKFVIATGINAELTPQSGFSISTINKIPQEIALPAIANTRHLVIVGVFM